MNQKKAQPTAHMPYLFEHVFRNLVTRFWINILKPEVVNIKKIYMVSKKPLSSELFEVFPRSNIFYKQMICDLTDIAQYDLQTCINYLFNSIGDIAMKRKSKTFDSLDAELPSDQFTLEFIRRTKKLLLTDLIATIVSKMSSMDQQSAKNLITCGIYFCMSQQSNDDFPIMLLKQWSVIFSYISNLSQNDLFDRLTQLIINKYDLFFTLMRFVRLDNKKGGHSDDILEIMTSHLKRAMRKKILTSSMFISISTILSTYRGESDCIKKILAIAKSFVENVPKSNPGAIDLIVTLLPFTDWSPTEKEKFFFDKVFPLAQTEDGILSAARSFRTMMFDHNLHPDFLFFVWSPNKRENSLEFLEWEVPDSLRPETLTKIFNQYFLTSPYLNSCSSIIQQIIVRLAAMDFKNFIENIFPHFVNTDIDSPQFKVFMSIVPMINDEKFMERSNGVSKEDVDSFNTEFANTANTKMQKMISSLQGYSLHITESYKNKAMKANKTSNPNQSVLEAFNKLHIDIGTETNFQSEENQIQKDRDDNSNKIVRIIPYLVNSKMFLTKEWMKSFVRLSALSDEEVSKPAYSICQSIFQQEEKRMDFCAVLIEMSLDIEQKMEVLYICLTMLIEITDLLEPNTPKDDDAYEYNIEFVALLGLASNYPVLRSVAFDLLIRANKLLQNQGLYSQIEDHIPAIASNVNHSIMLQTFPKRPGKNEYMEDVFSFANLLYSNYQEPWLFFLAEFGRVIIYSKYNSLLKRIKEHCQKYAGHIKEIDDKNHGHLDLGLLVIFISSCTIIDCFENNLFVYEIPIMSNDQIESFSEQLEGIIYNCFNYEKYNLIFKALKHVNYTVVPMIFNILKNILKKVSSITTTSNKDQQITFAKLNQFKPMNLAKLFLNVLPSIHLMLSAIEGTKISSKMIQLTSIEMYFIICSDENTMDILQSIVESKENSKEFQQITLSFLIFLNFCMECYIPITSNDNNANNILFVEKKPTAAKFIWEYLCFLLNLNDKENPKYITVKTYAAWVLQTIINKANKIIPMCKEPEIKTISNCERYGYNVLYSLLKLNTFDYFPLFANSCFRRKGMMADAFFTAIHQQIFELDRSNPGVSNFYNRHAGLLLLLGILRLKTGSPYAKDFLEKFNEVYPHRSHSNDNQKESIDEILKDPATHFERITEQLVKAALEQMKDKKFKGTIKVMVEILKKWIIKFRLLPNQKACIPSKVSYLVYPSIQFLNDLMEITIIYKYNHDFQRIVDLWATLLKVKDNQYTVPVFITEYATDKNPRSEKDLKNDNDSEKDTHTELKSELFKQLLEDKSMTIIPKTLAKRCKFAYYAYVTYQKKKDMDNEFWIVDVLITALKKFKDYMENFLPELLHFAILFHANQTQSLLKRLCKKYEILYTRRTLSTISIQNLVADFNKKICEIDEKMQKKFEENQKEEEKKKEEERRKKEEERLKEEEKRKKNEANSSNGKELPNIEISDDSQSISNNSSLHFVESSIKVPIGSLSAKRPATPTTITKPFQIPIARKFSNNPFIADNDIITENSSSSTFSPANMLSTTDDEFESQNFEIIHPHAKHSIKNNVNFRPLRSQSTPPAPQKKRKSLIVKWAKEAMRWTIGTQNLRIAYMSLIILNSLKYPEMDHRIITDLLIGVCKSTAYFLSVHDPNEDKSLLYDFIDEAFKLFKTHFENNEILALRFIESFLSFVVSVDAYFENMLPLFENCLSSKITERDAQDEVLAALKPYFNELESDSTARAAFTNFEKKATKNAIDIKFVKIVLRRTNIKRNLALAQEEQELSNDEEDDLLIQQASDKQLNSAFVHYSLMVGNASADLKRRIFTISSKIISKIQNQRKIDSIKEKPPTLSETNDNETDENLQITGDNSKENENVNLTTTASQSQATTEASMTNPMASLSAATTGTATTTNTIDVSNTVTATTTNTGNTTNTTTNTKMVSMFSNNQQKNANPGDDELEKNDLNAQALLIIFNEAANCLPWMKEAIDFIKALSIFYPMISTVPLINEGGWAHSAKCVIENINKFAPKEKISVSLVNCSNLNALSILLTVPINDKKAPSIKVLPFSSILDTFPINTKEPKRSNFEDLTKTVLKISTEFKNKIMGSISPKADYFISGHWEVIKPSTKFIDDTNLWMKFKIQKNVPPLLTPDEFLRLGDK